MGWVVLSDEMSLYGSDLPKVFRITAVALMSGCVPYRLGIELMFSALFM